VADRRAHLPPYTHGNRENHEPRRERKLLLHRREIERLVGRVQEKGWTLVPLDIHLRDGRAKVQLGLARGKKQYDKRETIAKRDPRPRTAPGGEGDAAVALLTHGYPPLLPLPAPTIAALSEARSAAP
jgi:hypothetical protein